MKLYAYGVVTKAAIEPDIAGLFERSVYSITTGGVTALVSDFAGESLAVTGNNVLVHQEVLENVLQTTTPLPFRFGTVVTEPQLRSYLDSRQEALLQKLRAVDNCVEMGVKVIWRKPDARGPANYETESGVGPGTAFLRAKSEEIIGSQQLIEEADDLSKWLKNQVGLFIRDSRITVRPAHRLVIAADYLVERSHSDLYRAALQQAREKRPDLHFLSSGPWPPYSFANIDLEFKSHFGVS